MQGDLRAIIAELIGLGVGMEVRDGQPTLLKPERQPERRRAELALDHCLDVIRGAREQVVELWAEVAAGVPEPGPQWKRCRECRAKVYIVPKVVTWAFCESLYCPYRRDEAARKARYFRDQDRERQKREQNTVIPD